MDAFSHIVQVKTVIVGDLSVGKTSLVARFCHGEFPEGTTTTIGASFLQKRIEVERSTVELQLWDTAGHERYLH